MKTKGLGKRQKAMMKFLHHYNDFYRKNTLQHIDPNENKVAYSLYKRGLIQIWESSDLWGAMISTCHFTQYAYCSYYN